jgi:hypothetical protein
MKTFQYQFMIFQARSVEESRLENAEDERVETMRDKRH